MNIIVKTTYRNSAKVHVLCKCFKAEIASCTYDSQCPCWNKYVAPLVETISKRLLSHAR